MKYVKYFVVVAVLLIAVGILSGCGESEEDVLSEMPEGLYPMCELGDFQELWGYIDETGEYVIEPQFLYAGAFVKGLALVQDPDTELYGYINKYGEYVIQPHFCNAEYFNKDGIAAVAIEDKYHPYGLWGYIDVSGEFEIEPQFDYAKNFADGYAIVGNLDREYTPGDDVDDYKRNGFIIDEDLNQYKENLNDTLKGWDFTRGPKCKYDKKTDMSGYVGKDGEWVIKPAEQYGNGSTFYCVDFWNKMLGFETVVGDYGYLYGFLDDKGNEVIPAQFNDIIKPFENDVALVASPAEKRGEKAKYGYINKKGKYLIEKEYVFDWKDF